MREQISGEGAISNYEDQKPMFDLWLCVAALIFARLIFARAYLWADVLIASGTPSAHLDAHAWGLAP